MSSVLRSRRARTPTGRLRLTSGGITLLLLSGLLAISVVLALGALRAGSRANRASARALEHVASLTAWEFAQQASADLSLSVRMTTWYARDLPPTASATTPPGPPLPSADSLFAVGNAIKCECPSLLRGSAFAVVDLREGTTKRVILTGSGWRASDTAALTALAESMKGFSSPTASRFADTAGGRLVVWAQEEAAAGRLLIAQTMRDRTRAPVALYAALVDPAALHDVLARTAQRAKLLPTTLTRGLRSSELVSLTAETPRGTQLVHLPAEKSAATSVGVRDSVPFFSDAIWVHAALSAQAASIIGGLAQRSSPDQPLLLLLLAVVLVVVTAWQVRRQIQLAHARSEFIAGVSHELHAPLALITAFAETMLRGHTTGEAERRRFLDVILREARRLTRMVDNALRFSTSAEAAAHLERNPIAVLDLAEEVCRDMDPLARLRGSTIVAAGDPTARIAANRDALRQVLVNVLDNGIKYGPPGQTIHVSVLAEQGRVAILVDDQGPGIPRADRERVFDRFVRLATALGPDARSGTGIGLAVVRAIVREHGGTAVVEDAPTGGVRLRMTLPAEG